MQQVRTTLHRELTSKDSALSVCRRKRKKKRKTKRPHSVVTQDNHEDQNAVSKNLIFCSQRLSGFRHKY